VSPTHPTTPASRALLESKTKELRCYRRRDLDTEGVEGEGRERGRRREK